ncbi:hypothetical protein GCM10022234_00340 [Aeromicrobium panaciterrae]|uniref:hypothetical protein n=1 Tax=Aeromicrobium panaciterrae TaxID=363861 RepID=UPI0031D3563A
MTAEVPGQIDMLDLLAEIETPTGDIWHVVMPSMGLACGIDPLGEPRRVRRMVFNWETAWERVTCRDCLEIGLPALVAAKRDMQGRGA